MLIILTVISLIISALNNTYLTYINNNTDSINDFLIKYINGPLLWIDNILVYIFAAIYVFFSLKSKNERVLKISFSLFSVLTTTIVSTFVINFIADLFNVF